MKQQILQSFNSLLETPYISVEFGGKTFGLKNTVNPVRKSRDIDFIKSLIVSKKASGTVNKYSLIMDYVIEPGADPNYVDKIISSAKSREILFTYGDLSQPSFSYKKEKAIVTSIRPLIDTQNPKISYTIDATSSVALSYSIKRNFKRRESAKPSDVLFEIIYREPSNGLLELFPGMADEEAVVAKGWIARNDKEVEIEALTNITPYEYVRYLVSLMISNTDTFYSLVIHDTVDVENGPWFEVINSGKAATNYLFEVDVGYPGKIPAFAFNISDSSTSMALITEFQGKLDKNRVIDINRFGDEVISSDPSFITESEKPDALLKAWWKTMTSFPISASLTTRGLIVPAILCQNIKMNILFFGRKYNYSGEYMVTGQTDTISTAGYRTKLDLIRVKGDI